MAKLERLVIDRGEPFSAWLYFRKDSQRAGEALIAQLRAKGHMTEKEMSRFAKKLESRELGFKFSADNFYKKVLRTLVDLGFVTKGVAYGGPGGRTVPAYMPVRQPIPSERPDNPSFWFVTYEICRWWNEMMFPEVQGRGPDEEEGKAATVRSSRDYPESTVESKV